MKTFINGKFEAGPDEELKPSTQRATINYVLKSGFARNIMITNTHLVIKRLGAAVCFPIEQFISAAESVEPLLVEPVKPDAAKELVPENTP